MANITVIETVAEDALYKQYPGQSGPQQALITLDPRARVLSASYDPEIGNATPAEVYHGNSLRFSCQLLTGTAADDLMRSAEIQALATRICDGYTREWDGSNHVGSYTDDAVDARTYLADLIGTFGGIGTLYEPSLI